MSKPAPIHIFKPGRHTAMSGQALQFAAADLQATARVYDPAKHESPLVIGHPKHDLPAYGWVQGLSFSDGSDGLDAGLWAAPAQVNPDFADMVAAGAFKKISAAFYAPDAPNNPAPGSYYLRHVGFLGAQAPAVKGLRTPAFAADEAGIVTVEFGEGQDRHQFPTPPEKEATVNQEEAARLRADNQAQAARIAQLEADAQRAREASVHAEHTAFADALVADGRLVSSAKAVVVATLDHLARQPKPIEFGEGEHKTALIDSLKASLKAAPKLVEFAEVATRARAGQGDAEADDWPFADSSNPERLKQHKAIKAYMAQHKVSYATAAQAVLK